MDIQSIIKSLLILISAVFTVITLIKLGKKKKHFQIFPDSIKKEYFKEARFMTILNILSVVLIFVSCFFISSPFFYILIIASIFLTINSFVNIEENFGDLKDKEDE